MVVYEYDLFVCIVLTPSLRQASREHSELTGMHMCPFSSFRNHDKQRCGRSHDEIFPRFDLAGSYLGAPPRVVKENFVIKKIIQKNTLSKVVPIRV